MKSAHLDLLRVWIKQTAMGYIHLSRLQSSGAFILIFVASMALYAVSCPVTAQESIPLTKVDLNKVAGGWYIIATIPNFLERSVVSGYDVFRPQSDDEILEDFYLRKGGFQDQVLHYSTRITILPNSDNADWRVHIFGLVDLPFQVLYVDPRYRFILFGEQNRDWGWIYSRKQLVTDEEYYSMLGHFKQIGYKTDRFLKVVQIPAQIGQPGYWSEGIR